MRPNEFLPEEQLVLLLARGTLTPDGERAARSLLAQQLSWERILEHAGAHGVVPLLAKNLEALGFPGVPAAARAALKDLCARNAARSALLAHELSHVLEIFNQAEVPAVPLKGVALADRLYGDITLRASSDIDLLIPRHVVTRAGAVLRSAGYHSDDQLWPSPDEMELFLDSDIEAVFRRRDRTLAPALDLHWDIARRWRTDAKALDDLWAEVSRTTLWGVGAYRLSPEWEVLYLATHAVRHRWEALKWLVDIHDYCASNAVDWVRLAAKAERFGWGKALRMTLGLCRELLGTAVPAELARETPGWTFARHHRSDEKWKDSWIPARVLDRPADRVRYVLRLLLRPTVLERRAIRLPAAFSVIYYLLRPLRLAARWARPMTTSTLKAWRS
jgi:hypothetical protein